MDPCGYTDHRGKSTVDPVINTAYLWMVFHVGHFTMCNSCTSITNSYIPIKYDDSIIAYSIIDISVYTATKIKNRKCIGHVINLYLYVYYKVNNELGFRDQLVRIYIQYKHTQ